MDFGPVESEHKFIVSYTDCAIFGMIQKWKDELYVTISQNVWGKTIVEKMKLYGEPAGARISMRPH